MTELKGKCGYCFADKELGKECPACEKNGFDFYGDVKRLQIDPLIEGGTSLMAVANLMMSTGMTKEESIPILRKIISKLDPSLGDRPTIVCLCGSTRFMDAYHEANKAFTMSGQIVLTVEVVTYDSETDPQRVDPEVKKRLDELHLRKIDLADYVYVLNVGGYIGDSTHNEIEYARGIGKRVLFLEENMAELEPTQ